MPAWKLSLIHIARSGKRAGIPVGDGFLGRVIDPLGEPIDGKGPIEAVGYNPIEKQAPGILERQSVDLSLIHICNHFGTGFSR